MSRWYKMVGDGIKECSIDDGARLLQSRDGRIIAQDHVRGLFVSTVFLSLDHSWTGPPPLVFETMVFPDDGSRSEIDTRRYSSKADSLLGHAQCFAKAMAGEYDSALLERNGLVARTSRMPDERTSRMPDERTSRMPDEIHVQFYVGPSGHGAIWYEDGADVPRVLLWGLLFILFGLPGNSPQIGSH